MNASDVMTRPDGPSIAASPRMVHQPALDGMRGLAVAGVVLFHGGRLRGGFLGVDTFFVLSGFLITSLLLAEAARDGRIALTAFWARRARRLLPALAVVLVGVIFYAIWFAAADEFATIRRDAIATMLYAANWRRIFSGSDYFATTRAPSPLQHTWSLSIEEQFYLLWPLVVLLLARGRTAARAAGRVLVVASAGAVASLVWALLLYSPDDPSRVYYGTDTRIASMLIGAALAALLDRRGPVRSVGARHALEGTAVVGAVGLAVAWARVPGDSVLLYRGGLALSGLTTAVLITAAVHPRRGIVARALALRPLCALGLISYGVYLWHWPLFVTLTPERVHLTGWPLFAVRVAVTLLVATVSYRVIEMPVRHGAATGATMRRLVPVTAAALAVAIWFATTGPTTQPAVAAGPSRGGIMVIGDSVARSLVIGLQRAGLAAKDFTKVGCTLIPGRYEIPTPGGTRDAIYCGPFSQWVAAQQPDYVLLMTGIFDTMNVRPPGAATFYRPGTPAYAALYEQQLQKAIDELSATGATVLMPDVPCLRNPRFSRELGRQTAANDERRRIENELLRRVAGRSENARRVIVVGLDAYLCPGGTYQRSLGGVEVVRNDGEHFSTEGAELVARWLARQVPRLARVRASGSDLPDRLVTDLGRSSFVCTRAVLGPADEAAAIEALIACKRSGDRSPTLRVFADRASLTRWIGQVQTIGCAMLRKAGQSQTTLLVGDRWAFQGSPETAQMARAAAGGDLQIVRCT